ncbi:MurR/RpiR family transcriptional regulator [Streptococcus parauberis]|uniref:MurR/RpiR family transcriptional regulator n=1 Tax=Streptococcus parauberis TaxID=1348 RepID=UPI000CCF377B|nr:MurR/RpiR family transcriptional regulator [Streptococcus parauberis]PNY20369.1 HTH-type transcriptional regulator GlvR [Streptococcus parauberis]
MDWVTRSDKFYHRLSTQDLSILAYLEENKDDTSVMTSQELADACYVSRSSISRFLKKLEIDSFAELKFLLKNEQNQNSDEQTNFKKLVARYHVYIDQIFEKQNLHQLVDLLLSTNRLYLYGTGNAQKMEVESLRHIFSSVGKEVIVFFDKGEYEYVKNNFQPNDLILLLSYKGESQEAISILKDIRYQAIQSLVMTQTSNNSMAKLADYQLYVPTESIRTPTKRTYEVSTTFYFIIDQLFYDYCLGLEKK